MMCKYRKEDEESCNANAMKDSDYCFMHNPEVIDERTEARIKGGSHKIIKPELDEIKIENVQDIIQLLAKTINEVRKGDIDTRRANCIGYLANYIIKAMEVGKLESEVEELYEKLVPKKDSFLYEE